MLFVFKFYIEKIENNVYLRKRKEKNGAMENYYRNKLINAIKYFAKQTKHANYTKIFKLLNFFDFEHFCQTGYPAIGLKYYAFRNGPVPKELWIQIKNGQLPDDFKKDLGVNPQQKNDLDPNFIEYIFKARTSPDLSIFSPREQKILENLAFIYKECTASEISKISHEAEMPWSTTIKEKGLNAYIDYILSFKDHSPDMIENAKESLNEHFEMLENFKLNPV
jgi:uncharacterized phage-associated protein